MAPRPGNGSGVRFIDLEPSLDSLEHAVIEGLAKQPKAIASKFFYDERGSELFERICEQPEYYPTRVELSILRENAARLAEIIGAQAHVIELGAGALEKVRILLAALDRPAHFTALDISGDHLLKAAEALAEDFSQLPVTAVCADYTHDFRLPEELASLGRRRVGFFPGSTIGNFPRAEAVRFLREMKPVFSPGGLFIVGVDLKKEPDILNAAYNDAAGVTAAFNLNLLARINRELGGDFDLERFAHRAAYDPDTGCVETHIESLADQDAEVTGRRFRFARGERIHTEHSCKYTLEEFRHLARDAGWRPLEAMTDADALFSVHILGTD